MRFKITPQLPAAGRTRAWHHHGSHTPTSPGAILPSKMAYPKQIRRQCMSFSLHVIAKKIITMLKHCFFLLRDILILINFYALTLLEKGNFKLGSSF